MLSHLRLSLDRLGHIIVLAVVAWQKCRARLCMIFSGLPNLVKLHGTTIVAEANGRDVANHLAMLPNTLSYASP